jgi:hypothetical protein
MTHGPRGAARAGRQPRARTGPRDNTTRRP